jgi:nucleoside-diphosphate-sugar epimerase
MDFSGKDGLVKTAIICPPDIYGPNTGVGNRSTFLVPEYIKHLLAGKEPFYWGKGENWRAVSHIDDVFNLFIILLDNAVRDGGEAQWGKEVSSLDSCSNNYPDFHRASTLLSFQKSNGNLQPKPSLI